MNDLISRAAAIEAVTNADRNCLGAHGAREAIRTLPAASQPEAEPVSFQQRVRPWMLSCFGAEISGDRLERGDRLLEEVFELLQSGDYPKDRVAALTGYVWSRPAGEPAQEVGGVMVTLAAYCLAHELDMHEAAETELARIWTKVEKIRAKQKAKPTGSALPQEWATPAPVVPAEGLADYDAGLLNDFGGGDVGWWQDYLRAEIGRANEFWREQVEIFTLPVASQAEPVVPAAGLDALVDGWDTLKDNLPPDGHSAAEVLFDYGDKLADAIQALPAASQSAAPVSGVTAKPLVWDEEAGKSYRQANCIFGQYQVSWLVEFECWQLSRPHMAGRGWRDGFSRHSSKDDAKLAAQADYEARILAALEGK